MFPLQFLDMLGRFDLECSVSGGGRSSQAGALRLAVSRALLSFLSEGQVEAMRQGGSEILNQFLPAVYFQILAHSSWFLQNDLPHL